MRRHWFALWTKKWSFCSQKSKLNKWGSGQTCGGGWRLLLPPVLVTLVFAAVGSDQAWHVLVNFLSGLFLGPGLANLKGNRDFEPRNTNTNQRSGQDSKWLICSKHPLASSLCSPHLHQIAHGIQITTQVSIATHPPTNADYVRPLGQVCSLMNITN